VGPRTGLGTVVRRQIPSPCSDSKPPIIQPVAQSHTTEPHRFQEVMKRNLIQFNLNASVCGKVALTQIVIVHAY
jgi:hypothetical protein